MSVGAVAATRPGAASTDHSSTITLGGSDQLLMAAKVSRRGLVIQNQSSGDLWVNLAGATASGAAPSVWLPPGAFFAADYGTVPTTAVRIFGVTTGQAFFAQELT